MQVPLAVKEANNSQTEVATKKSGKTESKAKAKSESSAEQDLSPAADDKSKKLRRIRKISEPVLFKSLCNFGESLTSEQKQRLK